MSRLRFGAHLLAPVSLVERPQGGLTLSILDRYDDMYLSRPISIMHCEGDCLQLMLIEPTSHRRRSRSTRIVQFAILIFRSVRKTKPFSHTRDLLRSHGEKVIEALFLAELITPPTMADETKRTIADVTSLHDASSGSARKRS